MDTYRHLCLPFDHHRSLSIPSGIPMPSVLPAVASMLRAADLLGEARSETMPEFFRANPNG
ncbi:hypothetical protein M434DRAFT_395890 [Hypoxylon sp. CO27-5]|nr:hypothetical protein M434DRAFT_395890 [Hypoxylon sp. CO27-5]